MSEQHRNERERKKENVKSRRLPSVILPTHVSTSLFIVSPIHLGVSDGSRTYGTPHFYGPEAGSLVLLPPDYTDWGIEE